MAAFSGVSPLIAIDTNLVIRLLVGDDPKQLTWYEHPGIGRVELKRKQVDR